MKRRDQGMRCGGNPHPTNRKNGITVFFIGIALFSVVHAARMARSIDNVFSAETAVTAVNASSGGSGDWSDWQESAFGLSTSGESLVEPMVTFLMGSPTLEPCRKEDENRHSVLLTRGFFIQRQEVTRGLWQALKELQPELPADPSFVQFSPGPDHPVQCVTWYEAVLFANELSLQMNMKRCYYLDVVCSIPVDPSNYLQTLDGCFCDFAAEGYRLPTEAEWEYACRSGTSGAFSCTEPDFSQSTCSVCHDGVLPSLAEYSVFCSTNEGTTAYCGSKFPNPAGVYDMHGNVGEWCWDWYGAYDDDSVTDPFGPSSGLKRVSRSGGWLDTASECRSAARHQKHPALRVHNQGFRLVRTMIEPDQAETIDLDLIMPDSEFSPGKLFALELRVVNSGTALSNAKLFIGLSLGTGELWLYPGWVSYPPESDYRSVDVAPLSDVVFSIIQPFLWPDGAGDFDGAMFVAAMFLDQQMVSNLADIKFSCRSESFPTPTPTPTTIPDPPPLDFITILPAYHIMGSPTGEYCRSSDEQEFMNCLVRSYSVQNIEVTRGMWANLKSLCPELPDDPSQGDIAPTLLHPVNKVTWYETILYANLASIHHGYEPCYYKNYSCTIPVDVTNYDSEPIYCDFDAGGYRLPRECEWEYACSTGKNTPFSCFEPAYLFDTCQACLPGSHPILENYCIYCCNSGGMLAIAGSTLPNQWGLYDMHGNAGEWCFDKYGPYPDRDWYDWPGSSNGVLRIVRGGNYKYPAKKCRNAARASEIPDFRDPGIGFRLVKTNTDNPERSHDINQIRGHND